MFSEHENSVLKILGRRKMTVREISQKFYQTRSLPLERQNYIAQVIRRIDRKCEKFKLNWTLTGQGGGRGGRTIWRAKRGK